MVNFFSGEPCKGNVSSAIPRRWSSEPRSVTIPGGLSRDAIKGRQTRLTTKKERRWCLTGTAKIPLDLSCRTTCRTTSRTTCRTTCRRPGRRQVGDQVSRLFFCSKLVCDQVPDFLFVENLPLDLSRHVEIDLSCRRPGFWLFSAQNLSETWF